jgi:hypothetical protein
VIGRDTHGDAQGDADAGLFVDLADGGLGESLAGIALGRVTSRYCVRWINRMRSLPSTMRHSTPPAA